MAMPLEDQRVRPRAQWYAVPAVLWALALVLFVLAVIAIAHVVNGGVDRVTNNATMIVPSGGLTFYTTDPASTAECSLVSQDDVRTPLEALDVNLEFRFNGPTYYGLGVTPDSLAAGTYRLECNDVQTATFLGTGPRIDVTALATRFLWGILLPLILTVAGFVVLIVLLVKRHTSKANLRARHAYAASDYGSAWNRMYGPKPPPPPPPSS